MKSTALLGSLVLLAGCPTADEPLPELPGLPTVQGLTPAVDLDPTDDVAEYAFTVRSARVE
jgi:hypothetical protein